MKNQILVNELYLNRINDQVAIKSLFMGEAEREHGILFICCMRV